MAALAPWPDAPAPRLLPLPPDDADDGNRFGACVRRLRHARGWSQEALARRMGGTRRTIRAVEAGRSPYRVTVVRLADAFGLADAERAAFLETAGPPPRRTPAADGGRFGALLRRYRLRSGRSQADLGGRCNVVASYVGRIEAGERSAPTRPVVDALAAALALSVPEADGLLLAAGYAPAWAQDKTVRQVAQLLDGDAVLAAAVRCQVAALARMTDEGDGE